MYYLALILSVISLARAQKISCFDFPGHAFLEFEPNNLNISHNAHFSLQLQTRSSEGVVMYAEGPEDYEAVFLSQGKLVYLLTNPSPSGVEGTTGGLYISNQAVNNGTWLAVDVWRNWEVEQKYQASQKWRTGLEIRDLATGLVETHFDDLKHRGVRLNATVSFGGVSPTARHTKGSASPEFVGMIRRMHEERNDVDFDTYSFNSAGKVGSCS